VETLLNAYPHLKIFVCSQTYRFWVDSSNVFIDDSDTHVYGGAKLTDFVAKTKEVAKEYHLPYIDNYDIGMNKYNRSYYFSATDGTHPLTTGCHLIAQHIAKELF
jgi:lysophospholipase L1-like esterase